MNKRILIASFAVYSSIVYGALAEDRIFTASDGQKYAVRIDGDLSAHISKIKPDGSAVPFGYSISPGGELYDETRKRNVAQDFNNVDGTDIRALRVVSEMREDGVVRTVENHMRNDATRTNDAARYSDIQYAESVIAKRFASADSDMKARTDKNAAGIQDNTSKIGQNTARIEENSARIDKNAHGIAANSHRIDQNAARIDKNEKGIATNSHRIDKNTARIDESDIKIEHNTRDIAASARRIDNVEQAMAGFDDRVQALDRRIGDVQDEARAGIANAMAIAALRFDGTPGKISLAGGFGGFRGANAFAAGLGYTSEANIWRVNAGVATNMNTGETSWNAGASFTFN